jgi:phosphopantothenoylcysteine synthetase/decarboxylase
MAGTDISVIVCGAPLAARTGDVVAHLLEEGWQPSVIGTPVAMEWLDGVLIERLTGRPVRTTFRSPAQPKARPASAVVVCPATFNTLNKAAAGVADTYALAQLCEALGSKLPTVIVPMVNDKLWGHPAWIGSLSTLQVAGAVLVDVQTGDLGTKPIVSGTGDDVVARFEPQWISSALGAHS